MTEKEDLRVPAWPIVTRITGKTLVPGWCPFVGYILAAAALAAAQAAGIYWMMNDSEEGAATVQGFVMPAINTIVLIAVLTAVAALIIGKFNKPSDPR